MYFFDILDNIGSFQLRHTPWRDISILAGHLGIGTRGIIDGDPEDWQTTARATKDAWLKALNEYMLSAMANGTNFEHLPESHPIAKLWLIDFQNARLNLEKTFDPYHNAFIANIRNYQGASTLGVYVGTYDQWLTQMIANGNVTTGTTTNTFQRQIYPAGVVSETYTRNYGTYNDIKTIDSYYNNFKAAVIDIVRVTKTAFVLTDGDDFQDFEPNTNLFNTNCDTPQVPVYGDFNALDFMDDLTRMPTGTEIETHSYLNTSCDYTSIATMYPKIDGTIFGTSDKEDLSTLYRTHRDNTEELINDVKDALYLGFDISNFPTIDYEFNNPYPYRVIYYDKGKPRRVKYTWWSKASAYTEWNSVSYPTHGVPLSTLLSGTDDFKYLSAVANSSLLPTTATKGDLICVGILSNYIGYAWDPILNSWSTNLYDFIEEQILTQRRVQKNRAMSTKSDMLKGLKPFLWAHEYLLSDSIRNWQLSDVSGYTVQTLTEVVASNGASLPPKYTITASTHTLSGFTATTIIY